MAGDRPFIAKLLVRSMLTNVITRPHRTAYDISATPSLALSIWRGLLLRCAVLFWTVDSPALLDRSGG